MTKATTASILIAPDTRVTTGTPEWRALVHASHEWQYDTPPDDDCYHHYTQTTLCKHHYRLQQDDA